MSKKEIKENWTLGISRDVIEMSKKAVGTPKLGMGAKGRVNTARIYFICRREWTLRPVDICDAERILSGFKLDSFRLSLVLHLLGHFLHFWKGRTLAYVVSQFTVLLPVSFPPARFSDWHAAVPPIGERCDPLGTELHQTIKNDFTDQGEGILLGVIPKEADEHKKANQPKWKTKLTSNQTKNHLLQFRGWTATGASCSFCGSWCHSIFEAFCVSLFLGSLWFLLELFLLRASQARLCGSR